MGDAAAAAAATARHSPPASATPPPDATPPPSSRPRVVSDENDAGHLRFHLRSPLRPRSSPGGGAAATKGGIQMMDSPSPGRPGGGSADRGDADDGCAAPNRGCAELRAALDDVAAALAAGGGAAPGGGGGVASTTAHPPPPAAVDVVPDSEAASPVKLAPVAKAASEAAEAVETPAAEAATPPPPAATTSSAPPSPPADGPMDPADAEARYLGAYIAAVLPGDPAAAALARATPAELAAGLSNGVLLCRLLAATSPAAGVDDRAINVPRDGAPLPRDEALQNVAMALDAARAAGAALPPTLTPPHIVDADTATAAHTLDAAWAVAWLALSAPLAVAARPATLAVLRAPGEDAARFVAAPPTTLLLRWVNHHLGACGAAWGRPPVEDLSGDLVDSAAWAALAAALRRARVAAGADAAALPPPPALDSLPPLRRLQAGFADLDARRADLAARAAAVHPALAALAPLSLPLPPPAALAAGSPRVGAATLASLFAAGDALDGAGSADAAEVARALEDGGAGGDSGESRDDRTLRVWVASIVGVPPSAPEFLAALREGHLLLKALDALSPGCVDWKQAHAPPFKPLLARPRSIENANQAVDIARRLSGLPLVNVSGEDIVNGARKQAAALLWQLCRLHVRKLLAEATGGVVETSATSASTNRAADAALDAEVVAWANARVAAAGGRRRAASLHDRSLATGLFLLDLLAAVAPASVNPALVSPGRTAREKECNARYAIAAARKLGVSLPLLPEDLADASPRAALIFMAALMLFDKKAQG